MNEESCSHRKHCKDRDGKRDGNGCDIKCKRYSWDEQTYPTHDEQLTPFQRMLIDAMVRMNHDILDLAKASGLPLHTVRMAVMGKSALVDEKKTMIAKGLRLAEDYFDKPLDEAV